MALLGRLKITGGQDFLAKVSLKGLRNELNFFTIYIQSYVFSPISCPP